ncbi:MAG: methionine--tRNA ligase, partial [Clostridia bacterium]|nr:methionine--tRNA ligase [Clostridia bacterium]
MNQKYYITTAIAYTSKKPHIGNIYEAVLADCIARFRRMQGYDVYFLTGTDEHGEKIQSEAEKAGVTPQEYVDGVAGLIRSIWDDFRVSYDQFIRTTDERHVRAVQKIFRKFYEQGDIYKGSYEGNYCTPCESFWTDSQLVNGCCPDCGAPVTRKKEEAYFFRMSKYADRLLDYMQTHDDFITPESRRNEMINNFLKPGLQDLCVSRTSFSWGIPVDFDEKHVVYVWLDALNNYITAIGYDPDHPGDLYRKLWPADLHVIGKDIVRFHTIYWPIFLMALGEPLPKKVLGHPWLLFGEDKMSKSKGNVIYGDELIRDFGLDAARHYLLSEMGYYNDGSITYESLVKRTNTDLANTLGNLVSRTCAMVKQYFGGAVPANGGHDDPFAEALKQNVGSALADAWAKLDRNEVADASESVFRALKSCNKYIDETMPWALAKDPDKRNQLADVLSNLIESIRLCAVMLYPFIPDASEKILSLIGAKRCLTDRGPRTDGDRKNGIPCGPFLSKDAPSFPYAYACDGFEIGDVPILFSRID